jgi:hypothetical protein
MGGQIVNLTHDPSFDHIIYISNFPMENASSLTIFTFQELFNYGIKKSQFAQDLPPIYIFVPNL